MRKIPEVDVIIAGAGPCGLLAAILLGRAGLSFRIFEKDASPEADSFALALHPTTQALLHETGVLDEIRPHCLPVRSLTLHDRDQCLGEVHFGEAVQPPGDVLVVPQDVLERALIYALRTLGHDIHWSHRVARIDARDRLLDIEIDELDERGVGYAVAHTERFVTRTHAIRASFLIGADGHHSLVRRQAGIRFLETAPPLHYAIYEFTCNEPVEPLIRLFLEDDHTNVFWPMPGNHGRWSFQLDDSLVSEWSREKHHAYVLHGRGPREPHAHEALAHYMEARAPGFDPSIGHIRWSMPVRFESRLAESFGAGAIWLTGDAGHMTRPAGVQSMNVGLLETRDLVHSIAARIQGITCGERSPDSLDRYNDERQREWRQLLGLDHNPRPSAETASGIRSRLDRILSAIPASRQTLQDVLAQLGVEFEPAVPLVV